MELRDSCTCNVTSDNIDEGAFNCFEAPSSNFVTYRAQLTGNVEADIYAYALLSYIEDWVSGSPIVHVQGVAMKIDSECVVPIKSFADGECNEMPTSSSNSTSATTKNFGDNVAIVIGVVIIIIVIVILVFTTALIWIIRRAKVTTVQRIEQ